jgi:hypothetical protein
MTKSEEFPLKEVTSDVPIARFLGSPVKPLVRGRYGPILPAAKLYPLDERRAVSCLGSGLPSVLLQETNWFVVASTETRKEEINVVHRNSNHSEGVGSQAKTALQCLR